LLQFCRNYTRWANGITWRGEEGPAASGFPYYLCRFGYLYLVPISIAIAFYILLAAWLTAFRESLSIGQLISLQESFEEISSYFADNLKLSELRVLELLVLIYIISSVLLANKWLGKVRIGVVRGLYWLVERYGKYSGPIGAGLATLAALSLFGMQLGSPAQDLALRIKIHQKGYAEAARVVEARLSQEVTAGLYTKVNRAFPKEYREAVLLTTRIDNLVIALHDEADQDRQTFGVRDPQLDRMVHKEMVRINKVGSFQPNLIVENRAAQTSAAPPSNATPRQIEAARSAQLSAAPGESAPAELIHEGEKRISLQVEKLATEQVTKLTKPVTTAIPILEPLLQSFVEAMDQSLQDRIENARDRILKTLLRNPKADITGAAIREATVVLAETDVTGPVGKAKHRAMQLAREWRAKVPVLDKAESRLTKKVDIVVINLINDLGGSRAERAFYRLLDLGSELSPSHIDRLVTAMRHGNGAQLRHNAAVVVGHIESDFVSSRLRAEAKSICGCHS
jgi:hypothetical protein